MGDFPWGAPSVLSANGSFTHTRVALKEFGPADGVPDSPQRSQGRSAEHPPSAAPIWCLIPLDCKQGRSRGPACACAALLPARPVAELGDGAACLQAGGVRSGPARWAPANRPLPAGWPLQWPLHRPAAASGSSLAPAPARCLAGEALRSADSWPCSDHRRRCQRGRRGSRASLRGRLVHGFASSPGHRPFTNGR